MELERAQRTANAVIDILKPYCSRIEVVGSIRRKRPNPNDVDIVLIPKDLWNLHAELVKLGQVKMSGSKIIRVIYGNTQLDFYIADEATCATLLLIRTGSTQNNIRLCSIAKKKGWHLAANGDGLFNEKKERIAGDTEISIYQALGLPYKRPEERG
jgi:DNA polymerase (family 10)